MEFQNIWGFTLHFQFGKGCTSVVFLVQWYTSEMLPVSFHQMLNQVLIFHHLFIQIKTNKMSIWFFMQVFYKKGAWGIWINIVYVNIKNIIGSWSSTLKLQWWSQMSSAWINLARRMLHKILYKVVDRFLENYCTLS